MYVLSLCCSVVPASRKRSRTIRLHRKADAVLHKVRRLTADLLSQATRTLIPRAIPRTSHTVCRQIAETARSASHIARSADVTISEAVVARQVESRKRGSHNPSSSSRPESHTVHTSCRRCAGEPPLCRRRRTPLGSKTSSHTKCRHRSVTFPLHCLLRRDWSRPSAFETPGRLSRTPAVNGGGCDEGNCCPTGTDAAPQASRLHFAYARGRQPAASGTSKDQDASLDETHIAMQCNAKPCVGELFF